MKSRASTRTWYLPKLVAIVLLLACVAAAAACESSETPASQPGSDVEQGSGSSSDGDGAQSSASSSDEDDGDSDDGDAQGSSPDDGGDGSGPDSTVSRKNPGLMGRNFDPARNDPLHDAQPLGVVKWTTPPTISPGTLTASGTLQQGASLFDPMVEGEGAGFAVFYKGHTEPMVVLLPDLGPIDIWETTLTVATMEHEFEGASFTITAYSPLFMDVGPDDLELRVYGYDGSGSDALLAVQDIATQ